MGDPAILDFPLREMSDKERLFYDMRYFKKSSTDEVHLLAFADRFCRRPGRNARERAFFAYAQQSALDVVSGDKLQVLHILLSLFRARVLGPSGLPMGGWLARDIHLADQFYSMLYRFHGSLVDSVHQRPPLMRVAVLQGAVTMFGAVMDDLRRDPDFMSVLDLYARGESFGENTSTIVGASGGPLDWRKALRSLAFLLLHERVPPNQTLAALKRLSRRATDMPPPPLPPSTRSRRKAAPPALVDQKWESTALALVIQKTALSLSGPRTIPWSLRSINDFLELWYASP
jgi:hypothetical protein